MLCPSWYSGFRSGPFISIRVLFPELLNIEKLKPVKHRIIEFNGCNPYKSFILLIFILTLAREATTVMERKIMLQQIIHNWKRVL